MKVDYEKIKTLKDLKALFYIVAMDHAAADPASRELLIPDELATKLELDHLKLDE